MFNLLAIGALLFFAVIAPIKTVIATILSVLLVLAIVKFCTKLVAGHAPSWTEAFNAMVLSMIFVIVALMALSSFSSFSGSSSYTGVSALFMLGVFFGSYTLGFSVALGTKFAPSLIIAIMTSVISQVLFSVLQPLI